MYQIVFFDLDGTLTDSGLGITNSVAYALSKWNIHVEDRASLNKFVGPPLEAAFSEYYGFTREESHQALLYYREYFCEKGMFENRVYEGITELLAHLKATGRTVILATSKPEEYAVQILEQFGLLSYFDQVAGASMDEVRVKKSDVIAYALERADITDLSRAVMVGDRDNDMRGAADNGLASIGVLYGYGSREELEEAGADQLAETVEDLKQRLDGGSR